MLAIMKTALLPLLSMLVLSPVVRAADTDADGIEDGDEASIFGTDPQKTDSDGDGLGDGFEIGIGRIEAVTMANPSWREASAEAVRTVTPHPLPSVIQRISFQPIPLPG